MDIEVEIQSKDDSIIELFGCNLFCTDMYGETLSVALSEFKKQDLQKLHAALGEIIEGME